MSLKPSTGNHNKLPHYAVIGDKTNMHVWVKENGRGFPSERIKGKNFFCIIALIGKLYHKDKHRLSQLVKETHTQHSKVNYV